MPWYFVEATTSMGIFQSILSITNVSGKPDTNIMGSDLDIYCCRPFLTIFPFFNVQFLEILDRVGVQPLVETVENVEAF